MRWAISCNNIRLNSTFVAFAIAIATVAIATFVAIAIATVVAIAIAIATVATVIAIVVAIVVVAPSAGAAAVVVEQGVFGPTSVKHHVEVFSAHCGRIKFKQVEGSTRRSADLSFVDDKAGVSRGNRIQHNSREAADWHVVITIQDNGFAG